MDFDKAESSAAKWLESHKDFELVYVDKSKRRFQFSCTRLKLSSFFIICPSSVDANWVCNSPVCMVR